MTDSLVDGLRVLVDWSRDVTFTHPQADITRYVKSMQWAFGLQPYQTLSGPSSASILLDNSSGAFSTGNPTAAFYGLLRKGTLVNIKHVNGYSDSAVPNWGMYIGRIMDITPSPRYSQPWVTITLGDWHDELSAALYEPPFQTNVTVGTAIGDVFSGGAIYTPYAERWWVLGGSTLGTNTRLFNGSIGRGFGSVASPFQTLPYVGDNIESGAGVSALQFIEEMAIADLTARVLYDGQQMRYARYPRNFFSVAAALTRYDARTVFTQADLTLDDEQVFTTEQNLCNALELTVYPRTIKSAGSTLYRTTETVLVRAGANRTFTLRFRDPDDSNASCSATTVITPVANTDYTINTAADGSGSDAIPLCSISFTNNRSSASVVITNNSMTQDVYVTLLQVRGTPLVAQQPQVIKAANPVSVSAYGIYRQRITMASVADVELAQSYADRYVTRFSTPRPGYRSMTGYVTPGSAWETAMLVRPQTFHIVSIADASMGLSEQAYIIVGVQCSVDAQSRTWKATLILEDYAADSVWILGSATKSILGVSTYIGF